MQLFQLITILILSLNFSYTSAKPQCNCVNGGSCVKIDNHSSACVCTIGFTGEYCEFTNACENNPCKNNGVCQSFENSGVCLCSPGFKGTYCDEIVQPTLIQSKNSELVNLDYNLDEGKDR